MSDVEIPKVGKLPKKVLIPIAVGAAGFVAWRYWKAKNGTGSDAETTITDGEFGAVDSAIPGVAGAVSPNNSYGDSGNSSDGSTDPTRFTSNAQWTDYVVGKLQQSETWTYTELITAIGLGLAGRPTTSAQQSILRAALAVGGQPPSGSIVIVSGGDTAPLVAPGGGHATASSTSLMLGWDSVAGADHYVITRADGGTYTAPGTSYTVSGLKPNSSYTFKIAAANAAGTVGPSATVTGKTMSVGLKAPGTPKISSVTKSGGTASTTGTPGATLYIWYLNGQERAHTEGHTYNFSGLKPNTSYRITVAGDIDGQPTGPASAAATLKTKR